MKVGLGHVGEDERSDESDVGEDERERIGRQDYLMALSSFLIGGGRDDGDGGLLLNLARALDYYAAEGIGASLPRRLHIKVQGDRP